MSEQLNIIELFATAFTSQPARSRVSKRNRRYGKGASPNNGFEQPANWGKKRSRKAAIFILNKRGVRYVLNEHPGAGFNEAVAVNRRTGEPINGNVQTGPAG